MDYRFTMTNRLIALAVISFLLLLALLFALGFQLGQQWGAEEARTQNRMTQQAQPYPPAIVHPSKPNLPALGSAQITPPALPSPAPAPVAPAPTATPR
jgi:competence protein ComGC